MLERDIVNEIKKYLASLGSDVFFWKEFGGPYGTSGVPDIICCYKGRFLGLEVKLPTGRLTELQKRAIRKINGAGGIACRVESVEDVKRVIEQVDREPLTIQKSDTQGAKRRPRIPLVFICSPYRGNTETNVQNARAYCSLASLRGCIPFAPHLLFTQFLDDAKADERKLGMYMGAEMLRLCDELWAFGEPTEGMAAEMELAERMGIPVRRHDLEGQVIVDE